MSVKHRNKLRGAVYRCRLRQYAKWRKEDCELIFKGASEHLALLSGTHGEYWMAPREPTGKMVDAGSAADGGETETHYYHDIGDRAAKECYQEMRDTCEEERRG